MRELTELELQHISPLGKGRFTLIYALIAQLEISKGLVIEPKDWKTKGTPYRVIKNVANKMARTFTYGRMPDGSGWYVKRLS